VAPFLFHIGEQLPVTLDPEEAVEALWLPLRVLRAPANHCVRPVPGMPQEMKFPCVELPAVPLWGFTYRLLADWLGLPSPAVD
jgi:hypothetical protein